MVPAILAVLGVAAGGKGVVDTVKGISKIKDANGNITYQDASGKTTYDISEVNNIRNEIKEHIMNYGAVTTMTVSGSL